MTPTIEAAGRTEEVDRFGPVVRDIARGGLAGALTGALVAGIGGRIVMRLAALIVPSAVGLATSNGNTIGDITIGGTFALIVLGTFFGLAVGTIWVAISPWIPGRGLRRALLAAPIAVAVGGFGLVDRRNGDFVVLGHDAFVVAILLGLVALIGFTIALVDDRLDGVLPMPVRPGAALAYSALCAFGALFTVPAVLASFFTGEDARPLAGIALLGCGAATVLLWARRAEGSADARPRLLFAGRLSLLALVAFGTIDLVPEVRGALGME